MIYDGAFADDVAWVRTDDADSDSFDLADSIVIGIHGFGQQLRSEQLLFLFPYSAEAQRGSEVREVLRFLAIWSGLDGRN